MTKEELKEYIETKGEIKIIEEKIEFLKEKKTSIKSMVITDEPRCCNSESDRLGKLLGEIEELIDVYNKKQDKLFKQQMKIEKCIDKLDSAKERNIMRLRYLEGHKWEKVCVETNYSWEGIHKVHRRILNKIK